MDKNTIIAIVLCVIVIGVGMGVQTCIAQKNAPQENIKSEEIEGSSGIVTSSSSFVRVGDNGKEEEFLVSTPTLDFTFSTKGATITRVVDKENDAVLLLKDEEDIGALALYWGNDKNKVIDDNFTYTIKEQVVNSSPITRVTFSCQFIEKTTEREFALNKTFAVPQNGEYLIQLNVSFQTLDGEPLPLNTEETFYTISAGPQVGPEFENLSNNYDYRRNIYKLESKNSKKTVNNGKFIVSEDPKDPTNGKNHVSWAGVSGKYFSFILIPPKGVISSTEGTAVTKSEGLTQKNTIYMSRRAEDISKTNDLFSFYIGPQTSKSLKLYNKAENNIFELSGKNLNKALDTGWLTWLENLLGYILTFFHWIIPNYGVAIILLTILVKALLIPLSKKGTDSSAKMAAIQPQLQEIQTKYKDDPQTQNAAMQKLYKEAGINPMGSCWPMLIQFPIFIGLYGLLNKSFALRGAMFIPGWIPDLSIPETLFTFPFNIPLLGNKFHLLPILYTLSMIFSMKISQSGQSATGSKGLNWFMTYGMSIIFFFVLYNAPSGLHLYWMMSNLITIGDQLITNRKKVKKYKEEFQEKNEIKAQKKANKKKHRK